MLQDSITKLYKSSNVTLISDINKEANSIADELELNDRLE